MVSDISSGDTPTKKELCKMSTGYETIEAILELLVSTFRF